MSQQTIEGFRLSHQQQRIWLLQQLDQSPVYRVQGVFSTPTDLDVKKLETAINEVVQRHEILRTSFHHLSGMLFPLQVVDAGYRYELELHDFSAIGEEKLSAFLSSARQEAVNFAEVGLGRFAVIKLSASSHVLVITLPALCADESSLHNFIAEVAGHYSGTSTVHEVVQQVDYAEWQHELFQTDDTREDRERWQQSDLQALLDLKLPLEKLKQDETFSPECLVTTIDPQLFTQISAYVSDRESSMESFLLAAWQTLLWRVTQQPQLAIATGFACRSFETLQFAVGPFSTNIPLRFSLQPRDSFAEILAGTQRGLSEAVEAQDYFSWEQFGNAVTYAALGFEYLSLPASPASFRLLDRFECCDRHKLRLACRQSAGELLAEFQYDPASLSEDSIRDLSAQFHRLLQSVIANPDGAIESFEILGDDERRRVLDDFNQTEKVFPESSCIHEIIAARAASRPDDLALVFEEKRLTYAELNSRSNRLGHYLKTLGVGPETIVGLYTHRSSDTLIGLLGVLKAGGAYLPLDPTLPATRLLRMLDDAGAGVVLTQQSLLTNLDQFEGQVFALDADWSSLASQSDDNPHSGTTVENLAYFIFTSGSTGTPKAVGVEHRQVNNYVQAISERLLLQPQSSYATLSTVAADLGYTAIFPALCSGATLHVISEERALDPEALAEYFSKWQIDCLKIVPSHLKALMVASQAERLLPRQCLVLGGEASSWPMIEKIKGLAPTIRILNHYGPTEATVGVLTLEVDQPANTATVPLGRPIANTRIYLLDAFMRPVPVGVPGELYVAGQNLSRGYMNAPESTAERFVPNPFSSEAGERLYRTGDLARYLEDGSIEFLGRADQQIKINGFRIEPGEVEATLLEHPSVSATTVMVREDAPGEKRLVAYVVVVEEQSLAADELRDFLGQHIPPHMVPAALVFIKSLPRRPNGKVDHSALPAPEKYSATVHAEFVPPATAYEKALAEIWAEVLGVDKVGIHDNFFRLGGDSIRSIRVLGLSQDRNLHYSMQQLFKHQTIHGLAQVVNQQNGKETSGPVTTPFSLISDADRSKMPPDVEDAYPLAKLQEGMLFHSELTPGSSMYHDITSVHLRCAWNEAHLKTSVENVTARHAVLRTAFDLTTFSEPLQLVYRSVVSPLEIEDIRDLGEAEQKQAIDEWLDSDSKHRYQWSEAPLLRYKIHRRTNDSFQFTLSRHHSVVDGWSSSALFTELFTNYLKLIAGEDLPSQAAASLTYRDFVALERQSLASIEDREYWTSKLGDSAINADGDENEAAQVKEFPVPVSSAVSEGLQRVAREAGLPLKDVLLAAHVKVMSLISGQTDVVTGLVMHGRPEQDQGEQVLGLFLNTLPLRMKLKGGSWTDLARQAFDAELELMPHRRYPLAAIQADLGRPRLFDTGMIFVNFHIYKDLEPSRGEIEPLEMRDIQETNFKFMAEFSLSPFNSQVELNLRLNSNAFSDAQVESIVQYYATTLARMAQSPTERHEAVCLLPESEQHQIVKEWNDTATEFPLNYCLHELIEQQVVQHEAETAVICDDTRLTYGELNERANQLAHYLQSLGAGPESVVGVCLNRGADLMVALLGILKSGAAYLPLDPEYPHQRLVYMLEDSGAGLLITSNAQREMFASAAVRIVALDAEATYIAACETHNLQSNVTPNNLAYVIYTSGSTGRPKGIMVSHENVTNFLTGMDHTIGDDRGTWLAVTSVSFDISVLELFGTLARGFQLVIQSETPGRFSQRSSRLREFADKKMDFSLFYFASDESEAGADKYQLLIEGAKFADENGFTAVWTPERHFHAFGGLYPNPSITGAVVAALTKQVKIRAGSIVLPLHNPVRVAEEWSVVDNVSKGRVGLSFASGWHANDFVLAPGNFQQRKDVMMRDIETVRRLWRGESVSLPGPFDTAVDVKILPHPIQPELPVWLTAAGNPDTFRAAGEIGANLLTHLLGQSIEELAEKIAIYRKAWLDAGHGPGEGEVTLMLHTFVGEDLEEVKEKVRKPFTTYLKSSVGLVQDMKRGLGYDATADLAPSDLEVLANTAFQRYFSTSGLLGTPESCLEMVDRLKGIGVDEIGCLIDFGVETGDVLTSLKYLHEVKELSNPATRNPAEDYSLAAQIKRHSVTHMQCTPSMAKMLSLDPASREAVAGLRKILLGGEDLPVSLVDQLQDFVTGEIHNMYGPTETTIWSTTGQVARGSGRVSIGRPIANTEVYLLDEFFQPVPSGTPGDLFIGGTGVARGYLNRPDLTADRFVPDAFSTRSGARMYRTGDRARYRDDGSIEFLGREDQQVKVRGYRIELEEIETVLGSHSAIRDAVVIARDAGSGEKQLVAFLVPDGSSLPNLSELRSYAKQRLPEYMVPAAFVRIDELPMTPNGKINRRALHEQPAVLSQQSTENYVAPRTAAESVVAGIWEQTLGIERAGVTDNFFELGGNSLSAIRIIARLREVFQVELPLRGLFDAPTIEGVVALAAEVWGSGETVEQIAETVRDIENLSPEEMERLLSEAKSENLVKSA